MAEVAVIDYGAGNLRSLGNALRAVGADVRIIETPAEVAAASRLILPGVGAFGSAMQQLNERGLVQPLREVIDGGRPFLGICLGFQVLFERSTEHGVHPGLSVVPGDVERFPDQDLVVPHMGWNALHLCRDHPLVEGIPHGSHVYFVHSYRPTGLPADWVLATTDYGGHFLSAVVGRTLAGVQFHPERSGALGLRLLQNFLSWQPE